MTVAIATLRSTADRARATVRSVRDAAPGSACHVLDLDGTYAPVGDETVHAPADLGFDVGLLRLTLEHDQLLRAAAVELARSLVAEGTPVVVACPGVVLVARPDALEAAAEAEGLAVLPRTTRPESRPADEAGTAEPVLDDSLYAVGPAVAPSLDRLARLSRDWRTAGRALDLFAATVPGLHLPDDAVLVSRRNSDADTTVSRTAGGVLVRDGRPVMALDLSGLDPRTPSVFDGRHEQSTGPLLSRNPDLAAIVTEELARRTAAPVPAGETDPVVRDVVRRALEEPGTEVPADDDALDAWLADPVPQGDRHPVARYLAGVYADRPDLRQAFPSVPGRDSAGLARWALRHGTHEVADGDRLERAARATLAAQAGRYYSARTPGVNLVGFLSGELGVGESARLMDQALVAAGVAVDTFPVSMDLQSRAGADYRRSEHETLHDVTLLCVNADQTPGVAVALDDVVRDTHRIGMWYWEVATFPRDHPGFAHVDEVWVATDFVRDALQAAGAPVPVRTVMPPLPQRASEPESVPGGHGIPQDREWFLFAFDYLSTAARKNPIGLVTAYRRAFAPGEGPALVLKTINADKRVVEAEALRLAVGDDPDVVIVDEYFTAAERNALFAGCAAYVSLHRAEGLGLTIAEAMAWGKPVIATAYSGNMQFMTSENSFPVPWAPGLIPAGCDPYPEGTEWAEPDLDAAARLMRLVVEDPDRAAAVGARAAQDIRTRHDATRAAVFVREALDARLRTSRRGTVARGAARLSRLAHRLGGALGAD